MMQSCIARGEEADGWARCLKSSGGGRAACLGSAELAGG
jgi:hypothetical protein